MLNRSSIFLLLATMATPGYSEVFGSLANFDVVNDTGSTAHGFEIDIRDIHSNEITSIFGAASRWPDMERYGAPTAIEYTDANGFGVKITYKATYNGNWSVGTPSGTLPVSPSDSCWPYGAPDYGPLYPCDHFGVSTSISTPNVTYSWLVESPGNPSLLTPVIATVPNPVWTVTPVPPIANVPQPPQVNVAIAAPAPLVYEFGEPRWVKVTATGTLQNVAVEDLVAENAVIKKANTQTQLEWQLIQVDAGSPGSGQIDLTGVALDEGATGVVYRFEFYKYAGARDAETNEARPNGSDTPGIAGPEPGDLGEFIVAQNAGINFDGVIPAAPPLPIAPSLNASIPGAILGVPYNQIINATPGNPGDELAIEVTGLPAGLIFDNATNAIVGTPTEPGTFPLVIKVSDLTNGADISASTQIQVAVEPIVFTLTLEEGTVGAPYNKQLSVTKGGYGAITYSIFGALPAGLTLTGDTINGIPEIAGSTLVTILATDSLGYTGVSTATLTIVDVINPPPPPPFACSATSKVISSVNKFWLDIEGGIANGGQSVIYAPEANTTFVPPLQFGVFQAGQLVSYTGTLDDMNFCVATSMTVAPGLSLNEISLIDGTVGVAYPAVNVSAIGGVAPYTIVVSGLPNGMSFDGATIGGAPTESGIFTVIVSASDLINENVFSNLTLTINAPVTISGTLGNGQVGIPYSGNLTAAGGSGALNWSVSGSIPGVNFVDGIFSGTPTTAGTYVLAVTVTDAKGNTNSATYNITIADGAPVRSCVPPAGATKGLKGQGKITAVNGDVVTFKNLKAGDVSVTISACTKITWNGANSFAIGQNFKWTGYNSALGNVAQRVTIN
ncbi:MAG: putative Ig domain-containing protein [Methylovulum sp.]